MALINFDASTVEPAADFTPIPVGDYVAIISESDLKDTKSGSGKFLQLKFQIVEGEYQGRIIFDNLNIMNSNDTAQKIAQQALAAICKAVGVLTPSDSSELHDKPMTIRVGIRPAKGDYAESNNIKSYKPLGAVKADKSGKRPWE